MRHHLMKPKGWVRKDRDYVMFEKGPFLHNMSLIVDLLQKCMYLPKDMEELAKKTSAALSNRKLEELKTLTEEARKIAWKYVNVTESDKSAMFLMLLDALESYYVAEAKQPDDFTAQRRTA